jgi:hypothetical protein
MVFLAKFVIPVALKLEDGDKDESIAKTHSVRHSHLANSA